ncbi:hypothetical protein RyT2_11910 [Pseudolactococcus yaeyamensis]
MIHFTLYKSNFQGNLKNCLFPTKVVITTKQLLLSVIQFDHVAADYANHYRSGANFISSDVMPLDCDNDHSDESQDWVTPIDVARVFPDVKFVVTYSRNHLKIKGSKSARPRFHVYFPIFPITSAVEYAQAKQQIQLAFPYFDDNAMDSARLLFGTANTEIEIVDGDKTVLDYLNDDVFVNWDDAQYQIVEGGRNNAMSHIAGKIIKRLGNSSEAHDRFLKAAEKCMPPLFGEELAVIWNSAVNFWKKVAKQTDYISPEQYNSDCLFKPTDFSDVGQATVLSHEYEGVLRYSSATDYIVYNGSYWEESGSKAQAVAQDLTERQLEESDVEIQKTMKEMVDNGAFDILVSVGAKKAQTMFNKNQLHAFERYEEARNYRKYAIKRRDDKYLSSALKVARPKLEIEQRMLDVDEFLLNTPSATFDLRTGDKQDILLRTLSQSKQKSML